MSNAANWLSDGNYKPAVKPPILTRLERLPVAIAEFDVGGLVRRKVSDYPIEILEELVLSVAQQPKND